MKVIKKSFEENDENPLEEPMGPGLVTAITIGAVIVVILICLAAASVYLAEYVLTFF